MKTRMLAIAGIAMLLLSVLPCSAQDISLPTLEPVKPPKEGPEPIKPPKEILPPPIVEEHCPTGLRVLWYESDAPLCSLWPREVITMVKQPTFIVVYREEKIKVADIVVKPTVVKKTQLCTCEKEVKVTDPVTGECSTVMQPVTEERIIEEVVYAAVRVERDEIVCAFPISKRLMNSSRARTCCWNTGRKWSTPLIPWPCPTMCRAIACSRSPICARSLPSLPCLGEKGCPTPTPEK